MYPVATEIVRISEDNINEFLHLPRDNFEDPPDEEDLMHLFNGINSILKDINILRYFYKNAQPKEWNLFFTIISYTFSVTTGGWSSLSTLI